MSFDDHAVVGADEWRTARVALLQEEKAFTAARDALASKRRALPWEAVTHDYRFAGENGERSLGALFGDRGQLIVYHFMFPPEWEAGCPHCSFWMDSLEGNVTHLRARDAAFVCVSRAPLEKLLAYRERMGWTFDWYSSGDGRFNYDYGVSFSPESLNGGVDYNYRSGVQTGMTDREGVSVFARRSDGIFHTYSAYARGIDLLNAAYNYIDLLPAGRDEAGRNPQYWVRRHDDYGQDG